MRRGGLHQWIEEAAANGAKIVCGGKRTGSILEPAVLTDTRPNMKVNCQESFRAGGDGGAVR